MSSLNLKKKEKNIKMRGWIWEWLGNIDEENDWNYWAWQQLGSLNVIVSLSGSIIVVVGDFLNMLIICYFALGMFYPNLNFKP